MSKSPETSPARANLSRAARKGSVILGRAALIAVAATAAAPKAETAEARKSTPEKRVQRFVSGIASEAVSNFRFSLRNPQKGPGTSELSDYDEAGTRTSLRLTRYSGSGNSPLSEMTLQTDMKRKNGRLQPSTASSLYMQVKLYPGFPSNEKGYPPADERNISMLHIYAGKDEKGDWHLSSTIPDLEHLPGENGLPRDITTSFDTVDDFSGRDLRDMRMNADQAVEEFLQLPPQSGGAEAPVAPTK